MAELDNSGANEFRLCPYLFQEGRLAEGTGLEPKLTEGAVSPYALGSRVHELLEQHYMEMQGVGVNAYPEALPPAVEIEAQVIFAAYKAKYPVEDFDVIDVERPFKVGLPDLCPKCYGLNVRHVFDVPKLMYCLDCGHDEDSFSAGRNVYVGKRDLVFRSRTSGKLNIMDHKTEGRQSSNNRPQKWAARDQATLYLWSAQMLYAPEEIENVWINVIKRPSEKLKAGPIFPDRQRLERTPEQIKMALRDFVFICDEVDRYKRIFGDREWPSNREECDSGWWLCDFYLPHTYGWSKDIRDLKFQPRTPYLELGGIPIIQP